MNVTSKYVTSSSLARLEVDNCILLHEVSVVEI